MGIKMGEFIDMHNDELTTSAPYLMIFKIAF